MHIAMLHRLGDISGQLIVVEVSDVDGDVELLVAGRKAYLDQEAYRYLTENLGSWQVVRYRDGTLARIALLQGATDDTYRLASRLTTELLDKYEATYHQQRSA